MARSAAAVGTPVGVTSEPTAAAAEGRLRIVSREVVGPAPRPSPTPDQLPDPRPWAARLAQVIAEVVCGARSPGQLSGVATLPVLRQLERAAGRFGATTGAHPTRPIVRSVHVSRVDVGAAEVCAVIITGRRFRALALRLDAVEARWRCTAVQLG